MPSYLSPRKILDDDDDDDDETDNDSSPRKPSKGKSTSSNRYKSTLLSFICDTSPTLTDHPAISFLGSPDHCTYVFEVRSRYACAGATPPQDSGSLGPGGVFGVILAIALLVYLIGGCVYNRTVMHQRGWRQLPNYAVWSGIGGFIGVSTSHIFFWRPRRLALGRDRSRSRSWSRGRDRQRHKRADDYNWKLPSIEERTE